MGSQLSGYQGVTAVEVAFDDRGDRDSRGRAGQLKDWSEIDTRLDETLTFATGLYILDSVLRDILSRPFDLFPRLSAGGRI